MSLSLSSSSAKAPIEVLIVVRGPRSEPLHCDNGTLSGLHGAQELHRLVERVQKPTEVLLPSQTPLCSTTEAQSAANRMAKFMWTALKKPYCSKILDKRKLLGLEMSFKSSFRSGPPADYGDTARQR